MDHLPPPVSPSSRRESELSEPRATIPPPPPLPPSTRLPKPSSFAGVVPLAPPLLSNAFDSLDKARFSQTPEGLRANKCYKPFQPCHMFFYGSLMDPEVIQAILDLSELPATRPATISGFRIKMWSIYPALIPSTSQKVVGTVWEVTSEDHFDRLAAYETAAYTWIECDAILEDGLVLKNCRTFCWAGEPDINELKVGSFDLKRYQQYFKSSVTRRQSNVR